MIKILFTSDYEIHGNGEGSPKALMVDPTKKMLELFDKFNAKLTIMADIAEILKFKEYLEVTGEDKFYYEEIVQQLKESVYQGHDVQLHIHSAYYKSTFANGKWKCYWPEYDFANLDFERMNEMIKEGKLYFENLLKPVLSDYECFVFRAANWSLIPSINVIKALENNNFKVDTSVFKYGKRNGLVNFDYSGTYSDTIPWPVDSKDIRLRDPAGKILEFPIYCELSGLLNFISPMRFYRVIQSKLHTFKDSDDYVALKNKNSISPSRNVVFKNIFSKHALKADFNQCTGKQLIKQLKNVEKKYFGFEGEIPFVTIGHSKLFNRLNEKSLRPFLHYVSDNPDKYQFATFKDFDLSNYFVQKDELNSERN